MKQRIEYYDFIRGIAIIMVIGIHTFVVHPIDTPITAISAFVRNMLNCAVPIFLALSGLFCGAKIIDTKQTCLNFWKKQIPKVYIPVLIWSVPYLFYYISIFNDDVLVIVKQLVIWLICGYGIYYFIALIIQFYILLPFLQKYKNSCLPLSIIISTISIIIITYFTEIIKIEIPLIMYAGPCTTWIMFFMMGVYYSISPIKYTLKQAVFIIILGLLLECAETYWINTSYGGGYGIKFSSYVYSAGVIMLLLTSQLKKHIQE